MRRFIVILAAAVALTGCKIEEAESFDPSYNGRRMFQPVNEELRDAVDDAARVFLFDLYYSASEDERETIHNRHFYTSRIYNTGDEWHIVDTNREIIISTGGKSLSEAGTTWRYRYSSTHYSDDGKMPSLTSRAKEDASVYYDFKLPYDSGMLTLEPHYMSQVELDGTVRYWLETDVDGAGKCSNQDSYYGIGNIDYEITNTLRHTSQQGWFKEGVLTMTADVRGEKREAVAEYYLDGNRRNVSITYNGFKKDY